MYYLSFGGNLLASPTLCVPSRDSWSRVFIFMNTLLLPSHLLSLHLLLSINPFIAIIGSKEFKLIVSYFRISTQKTPAKMYYLMKFPNGYTKSKKDQDVSAQPIPKSAFVAFFAFHFLFLCLNLYYFIYFFFIHP